VSNPGQADPFAVLVQGGSATPVPQADPFAALIRQQPSAPNTMVPTASSTPPPSVIADVMHALPGGVAKGVSGVAGLPGDIHGLIFSGLNKLTGSNVPTDDALLPSSSKIASSISDPFGGFYKPQTTLGQYAETAASFAPNAVMPGTMGQRLARMLIPAATSETAGQVTKGTPYEPVARALGAMTGGIGEGLGEGAIARAHNPAPTLDDLSKAKVAAYKAADDAGVVISPDSFQNFASSLGADITGKNVVQADIHPNTLAALNVIQDEASSGVPISLSRADAIRQAVNGAAEKAAGATGSNTDLRLVQKVKGGIDAYLDRLEPSDVLSGDPATAVPILKDARGIAQREFKAQQIQKMIDLAANSASTNYSASGYEQALRAQFKNLNAQLIKDPNMAKTFSDAERDAIENVAKGSTMGNMLRSLGKFSAHGPVSAAASVGLGAMAGSHFGGAEGAGIGALIAPTIGEVARSGATVLTNRNANLASELVRRGSPLVDTSAPVQKGLAALLLSHGVK